MEYIRGCFLWHRMKIDGIVTGAGRRRHSGELTNKRLEDMIAAAYPQTVHVDNQSLVFVDHATRNYREFTLSGNPLTWSSEVIETIKVLEKQEG